MDAPYLGFFQGAIAACGAVTFTNPWEVVKIRLQLQGELRATENARAYRNPFSSFATIFRNEGLPGIQKGLAPAYIYQILLNGTRLGLYDPLKNYLQSQIDVYTPGAPRMIAMVTSGAMSGTLGALFASPLFLLKTRMQSYSSSNIAVGHQHDYVKQGMWKTLAKIGRDEGIRGLWRGVDVSMMRTGVGSAVQLSTYDFTKTALLDSGAFHRQSGDGGIELHFCASLVTSLFVCIAMGPFDIAATRMYNQKVSADGTHGSLYKNGLDCIVKTVKSEGLRALYKGFTAHYLRIGPHTILTFVFLEQLRKHMVF